MPLKIQDSLSDLSHNPKECSGNEPGFVRCGYTTRVQCQNWRFLIPGELLCLLAPFWRIRKPSNYDTVHYLRLCKCLRYRRGHVLPGSLHWEEFLETLQAAARRAGTFPLLGSLPLLFHLRVFASFIGACRMCISQILLVKTTRSFFTDARAHNI